MKVALILAACLLSSGVYTREIGKAEAEPKGLGLTIQTCTALGNCQTENAGIVIDVGYPCNDPRNCNTIPDAGAYAGWGVTVNGNAVSMDYGPSNGARLYVTAGANADQYRMFYLLNKEMSVDIDTSTAGCGINFTIYLISMPADGGKAQSGYSGAQYGTGYCDAQPPQQDRPSCDEFDIWEANSLTTIMTSHACDASGTQCDPYGCGLNTYSRGDKQFYGRGANFQVDSSRPFTAVTQFVTVDGTDNGDLKEIRRYYVQDGKKINMPLFNGYDSLSDAYCTAFGLFNAQGGITQGMSRGLRKGMVASMSLWGSPTDGNQMSWMDNEPNGPCPGAFQNNNVKGTFSNIKVGPIGSTN